MSSVAISGCTLMKSGDLKVGLFKVQDSSGLCLTIKGGNSVYDLGRAFGVMASLFGGIAFFISIAALFVSLPSKLRRGTGAIFINCFVFQLLMFVGFANACDGIKCEPGSDGIVAIFAALFYLISGIIKCITPDSDDTLISLSRKSTGPRSSGGAAESKPLETIPKRITTSEKITETIAPDGKITVTKQTTEVDPTGLVTTTVDTTLPDGSKTITRTSEHK